MASITRPLCLQLTLLSTQSVTPPIFGFLALVTFQLLCTDLREGRVYHHLGCGAHRHRRWRQADDPGQGGTLRLSLLMFCYQRLMPTFTQVCFTSDVHYSHIRRLRTSDLSTENRDSSPVLCTPQVPSLGKCQCLHCCCRSTTLVFSYLRCIVLDCCMKCVVYHSRYSYKVKSTVQPTTIGLAAV